MRRALFPRRVRAAHLCLPHFKPVCQTARHLRRSVTGHNFSVCLHLCPQMMSEYLLTAVKWSYSKTHVTVWRRNVHKTSLQVFWDRPTDPDLHHRCLTRSLVWVGKSHSIFIFSFRKIRKESSCQRRPSPSPRPESRSAIRRQLAMQ